MWCLETLEKINAEAVRLAHGGLPERDALANVTGPRKEISWYPQGPRIRKVVIKITENSGPTNEG